MEQPAATDNLQADAPVERKRVLQILGDFVSLALV
jgi:hypothetical protein